MRSLKANAELKHLKAPVHGGYPAPVNFVVGIQLILIPYRRISEAVLAEVNRSKYINGRHIAFSIEIRKHIGRQEPAFKSCHIVFMVAVEPYGMDHTLVISLMRGAYTVSDIFPSAVKA